MTANDSKSTPKKAEDATRHPLALLADYLEARQVYEEAFDVDPLPSENHIEDAAVRFVIAEQALHAIDPAALRAQAEAKAGRAELLSLAVITFHRILKADDQGECCEIADWFLASRAPALKAVGQPTYNRATLAQAGGES